MKTPYPPSLPLAAVLALSACGSSQTAAPTGVASETPDAAPATASTLPAPASAEEDIRQFLLQEYPDAGTIRYALARKDLNGDGTDEAIVYLAGPYFCGTGGCNMLVLTPAAAMWSKVGDVSVSRTPVAVLDSRTNGWSDLTVAIAGGGGPSGTVVLKFDGKGYPGNASMAPQTAEKGAVLLAEEPNFVTIEAEQPAP